MSDRFPIIDSEEQLAAAEAIADLAVRVGHLTEEFANVERIPRYADGERETDVEHSFMLAVLAPEIAEIIDHDLNVDRIRTFSLVHDLLELKVGDVATFNLTDEQFAEKERLEEAALIELLAELPPVTSEALEAYERQDTPEAIFVRTVDKILPMTVDTTGSGRRVLSEDYNVHEVDDVIAAHDSQHTRIAQKFGATFPEVVAAHAVLCEVFEKTYDNEDGAAFATEQKRGPTEVERKYLVDLNALPNTIDLASVRSEQLTQGYLGIGEDGSESRLRSFGDTRFELTVKSAGSILRDEQTTTITHSLFESMWPQTEGRRIEKTRYYIPHEGDSVIELDVYAGPLEGLVVAEVEFKGRSAEAMVRATTFEPPKWFGRDVSEDAHYKNRSLATQTD